MATPAEVVASAFADAETKKEKAQVKLDSFLAALESAVQIVPLIDISFAPVQDPGVIAPPVYQEPDDYFTTILDTLRTFLSARMNGGSGIDASVEAAIWDRARERELAAAQAAIDAMTRDSEALGFQLPPGVLFDGIAREQRAYFDKEAAHARDVAIEAAKLEQTNIHKVIDQTVAFETGLQQINLQRQGFSVDIFRSEVARFQAEIEQDVKHWSAQIEQNRATSDFVMQGQKLNTEIARANSSALMEAAKTGAQSYAQLLASAYNMAHASASVSSGASNSVSYSYSNDTDTAPASVTAV